MKRQMPFTAFGQLVEERAIAKQIPLPKLAYRCGIHPITLRRGLQDARGPRQVQVVSQLCDTLGIDHVVAYRLLGWIPPAPDSEEDNPAH